MSSATTSGYRRPLDVAALANNFRVFADADCVGEPLYAALSHAVAEAPEVLELLMQAPYQQRRPVLLFAATHDLLLAGNEHALKDFYRSCTRGVALREDVADAGAPFVDFCRIHRDALAALLTSRSVQTNEVGRSAGLRLALSMLPDDRPIALIDVGCSAGLNLLVDRYRHGYRRAHGTSEAGPSSDVVIDARIDGGDPFADEPLTMPTIARRIGIDLSPLDFHDARDARWLRACTWPGDTDRDARLVAALDLARTTRLELHRGAATDVLDAVLADIDTSLRPVVFHSWVVSYFDQAAKHRLVERLRAMVNDRDGAWISAEGPQVVPGLAPPPLEADASTARREATLWHLTTRDRDRAVVRVIARSHPHGRWIEWLAG